jgi:uncharacterized protein (DUF1697 family)
MAHVVFLRGVNVGSARRFQPSALARELVHLGAANLGAAGTFVIRKHLSEAALRSEFAGRLPFITDLMICRSGELEKLAATDPFPTTGLPPGSRRFVSVLASKPRRLPPLPFSYPAGKDWQVLVLGVSGKLAWGLWRRVGRRSFVDPNGVSVKYFGVRATTRNWNTVVRLCGVLRSSSPGCDKDSLR